VEKREVQPPAPPQISPPAPPAPPRNPVITKPDWVRKPSGDAVNRAYPDRALRQNISGRVTLSCTVNADGTVSGCSVVSENPADYGFGDAAIRLSKQFKMRPQTADGQPVGGANVRIPLSFAAPE
jgi:protein TonB